MDPVLIGILVTFPVMFVAIWRGVGRLLSRLSRWDQLAERYATDHQPGPGKRSFQSCGINGVNFNNCLTFEASEAGLYAKMAMPLMPGFRPVLIPWSDITPIGERRSFTRGAELELEVGEPPIARWLAPTWLAPRD